ncbi:cytidyltransferase [Synechococcus phage S-SRM01]|uniref:Cytidyltransferase n=1 Tax=Synechococcus phage S-SRM01 TaxID=2781608 RepID=A0A879R209_9CAUD|nr:cytidyltransferase [Synechococcus phage S-SRM01]QPX48223.1 cytidyltransferase [Synechococcus phage S-SRM01]
MKNFHQFITEATSASVQAKRLGLVGDGHGGWYNRATGEFEAKTVGGQLKYFNKRQVIGGKDPKQSEFEKNIPLGSSIPNQPAPQQEVPVEQQPPEEIPQEAPVATPPPVPKTNGTLTIAFGRFNPPTVGHQQLMDTAAMAAMEDGGDYIIVPSRSQDKKKNPLDPDTKISYMRKMFPDHSERIVNDKNFKTIFDVLKKAHNDGYANVRIVGGSDRVKEFERLSNDYNGQLYQFDMINVVSSGDRDPDSNKGVEGVSASRLRLAAAEGDFITFRSGLPVGIKTKEALQLFDLVRQGMGIQEIQQEGYNTWEIAPKFDSQSLRENYIDKNIFKVGTFVENLNTGLNGEIIRRGTNYLICVTENGMMFKSWIKDVKESYSEKHMDRMMRLPGKPNTLIGTLGAFKYAAMMTPGAIGTGMENIQSGGKPYGVNLINKNRKKVKG